jgi:phosphoenolpyruvate synthase/pyruvate phosphate dikinase
MKTKLNLESVNFWFQEFRIPLFWITRKDSKMFSRDFVALYKNRVVQVYTLNNREIKEDKEGFKFFSKIKNVLKYEKEVKNAIKSIRTAVKYYKNLNVKSLSNQKLEKQFLGMLALLSRHSNVYFQTEPIRLISIDANEKKFKNTIKKLGKLRFILAKEWESFYHIIYGILMGEISRRTKISFTDFFFLNYSEMKNLFRGERPKSQLMRKRMRGYAYIIGKGKGKIITGVDFKKIFKKITKIKTGQGIIKGKIVMKGFARGKVRLILHNKLNIKKDVAKFKKGEILVTEMTRPDTILACRKASAIVTDEGGITSHAAIISRELKLPCIVATKIATQILKNGDLIEIDANKGIVKILKKK